MREAPQSGAQGAFACRDHFLADGIIVLQIERSQERLERQSLDHERAEDNRERGQHNEIAIGKSRGKRQGGRDCNNPPHPGPRNNQAASNRRPQHWSRRIETDPAMAPPDDSIEGHVPGEAHDDHRHQHCAGHREISRSIPCGQSFPNWPELEADENEGQDVEREHDRIPNGIRRDTHPCGSSLGRGPGYPDGATHHRQHGRETKVFGQEPDPESQRQSQNGGGWYVLHTFHHAHEKRSEQRTHYDTAGHSK